VEAGRREKTKGASLWGVGAYKKTGGRSNGGKGAAKKTEGGGGKRDVLCWKNVGEGWNPPKS